MEVNIGSIRHQKGADIHVHLQEKWPRIELDNQVVRLTRPVVLDARVINADSVYLVKGTVTTEAELTCARCLQQFTLAISVDLEERFRHYSGPKQQQEDDLEEEDGWQVEDVRKFDGLVLDLDEVVMENLLVSLPLKPLCRPDCKGLCPQCGQNLNEGDCDCRVEQINPRLAVLHQLLQNEKKRG